MVERGRRKEKGQRHGNSEYISQNKIRQKLLTKTLKILAHSTKTNNAKPASYS